MEKNILENLKKLTLNNFSHIYVEKAAFNHPFTAKILEKFSRAKIIELNNYKEIFSANNQDFVLQKQSQKLVLAVKHDNFIYKGAKVCESFGNENFYYTSNILNCVFDCEYCYLQGVYPSSNILIFVNIEVVFKEVENLLKNGDEIYLCISYDTDLLALELYFGLVETWYNFALKHKNLKIELRTKAANTKLFETLTLNKNFIIAYTISPQELIAAYEKNTASFEARLRAIKKLQAKGFTLRLCFDPLIYTDNFAEVYKKMLEDIFLKFEIDATKILDVNIGVFRISKDYIKRMRQKNSLSLIANYPYSNIDGVYTYSEDLSKKMIAYVKDELLKYVAAEKIFI